MCSIMSTIQADRRANRRQWNGFANYAQSIVINMNYDRNENLAFGLMAITNFVKLSSDWNRAIFATAHLPLHKRWLFRCCCCCGFCCCCYEKLRNFLRIGKMVTSVCIPKCCTVAKSMLKPNTGI